MHSNKNNQNKCLLKQMKSTDVQNNTRRNYATKQVST